MKLRFKYILYLCAWLVTAPVLQAQLSLSGYIDAGKNNVSGGLFIKTAFLTEYSFGRNMVRGGVQLDLLGPAENVLTATAFNFGREIRIRDIPFQIIGLYGYNRFSELMAENNIGLLGNISFDHFNFSLGTNFRTYGVTRHAADEYDFDRGDKIHENWNLMYLVGYKLKQDGHKWNVNLSVSNFDHFVIEQETNPVLFLRGTYEISAPVMLFVESWYKTAGSFNLSVNYFWFFFRTGVIWKIDI